MDMNSPTCSSWVREVWAAIVKAPQPSAQMSTTEDKADKQQKMVKRSSVVQNYFLGKQNNFVARN